AAWPESFCHKISLFPSPSKSPELLTCQLGPGLLLIATPPTTVEPLTSHSAAWPLSFCHRMSAVPLPSKSPEPLTGQLGPGLSPIAATFNADKPFMNHNAAWPESDCHKISASPSPSKSPASFLGIVPAFAICQEGPGLLPTTELFATLVPSISQIAA